MLLQLYTIHDKVSGEYAPPFVAKNDAVALRQYYHIVKGLNPDDYKLYNLGSYDTDTGTIDDTELCEVGL